MPSEGKLDCGSFALSSESTEAIDRLPQGSKFWVVLRNFHGPTFSPPRVYSAFAPANFASADLGLSVGGLPALGRPGRRGCVLLNMGDEDIDGAPLSC